MYEDGTSIDGDGISIADDNTSTMLETDVSAKIDEMISED